VNSGEIPANTLPTNISIDTDVERERREMIESLALFVVRQHRRQERKANNSNASVPPDFSGLSAPQQVNES